MSKKFKNKTCAYCSTPNSSTTGDHVFAREFFDEKHRHNLPKIPACENCNNEKSKLEHYLTTVLPFGSRTKNAEINLRYNVSKRLKRNNKLDRSLASSVEYRWVEKDGILARQMILPFDGKKYHDLFALIARGLVVHHWNLHLPLDYDFMAITTAKGGEGFFERNLSLNATKLTSVSLGDGMFQYKGMQSVDDPNKSTWKFIIAGGTQVLGDNGLLSSIVYAISEKKIL